MMDTLEIVHFNDYLKIFKAEHGIWLYQFQFIDFSYTSQLFGSALAY